MQNKTKTIEACDAICYIKVFFLCSFLFFCEPIIYSQESRLDSLLSSLENAKEDTTKSEILGQICRTYMKSDLKKAMEYADRQFLFCKKINYTEGMLSAINKKGMCYQYGGDLKNALNNYLEGLKYSEKLGINENIEAVYTNIGTIYISTQDYEKGLFFFEKSAAAMLAKEDTSKRSVKRSLAESFCNIGSAYYYMGDVKSALEYHFKAADIFKRINEMTSVSSVYTNLAGDYYILKDYENAIKYDTKALEIALENNDANIIEYTNMNIGDIYIVKKEYAHALTFYQEALEHTYKSNYRANRADCYKNMADIYKAWLKYSDWADYLEKYISLKDSLMNESKQEQLTELQARYETQEKSKEIELLKEREIVSRALLEKDRLYITIAVIGSSFLSLSVFVLVLLVRYRNKKRELEYERTKTELEQQALRARMNPHFIFNAINSIQRFVLQKNSAEAYKYLTRFSQLIRIVLQNANEAFVSLAKELEIIKLYVEIEQLRFENSFELVLDIDKNVDLENTEIPGMLIQPFIENAIWHGIMPLEDLRKGVIKLSIRREGEKLHFMVEDNGVGREASKAIKKDVEHKSMGMNISERRLIGTNLAGNNILVKDLYNKEGMAIGTRVEITISPDKLQRR